METKSGESACGTDRWRCQCWMCTLGLGSWCMYAFVHPLLVYVAFRPAHETIVLQGQLLVRSKVRKDFALKRVSHRFSAAGTCYWCAAGGLEVKEAVVLNSVMA